MKHFARIQSEFLKEARDWEDMSYDEQKEYLQKHRKSKRKLTAKPESKVTGVKEKLKEKRKELLPGTESKAPESKATGIFDYFKEQSAKKQNRKLTDYVLNIRKNRLKNVKDPEWAKQIEQFIPVTDENGRIVHVLSSNLPESEFNLQNAYYYQQEQDEQKEKKPRRKMPKEHIDKNELDKFRKKYSTFSRSLAKELYKIDAKMQSAKSGNGSIRDAGDLEFSANDGGDDKGFTMSFSTPKEFAQQLNEMADFVEQYGKSVEVAADSVDVDFELVDSDGNGIEDTTDSTYSTYGFGINFNDIKSPNFYRQLAMFMNDHPGLNLNSTQD